MKKLCNYCHGEGSLFAPDGALEPCPACFGKVWLRQHTQKKSDISDECKERTFQALMSAIRTISALSHTKKGNPWWGVPPKKKRGKK
jgi:hypothetical protein